MINYVGDNIEDDAMVVDTITNFEQLSFTAFLDEETFAALSDGDKYQKYWELCDGNEALQRTVGEREDTIAEKCEEIETLQGQVLAVKKRYAEHRAKLRSTRLELQASLDQCKGDSRRVQKLANLQAGTIIESLTTRFKFDATVVEAAALEKTLEELRILKRKTGLPAFREASARAAENYHQAAKMVERKRNVANLLCIRMKAFENLLGEKELHSQGLKKANFQAQEYLFAQEEKLQRRKKRMRETADAIRAGEQLYLGPPKPPKKKNREEEDPVLSLDKNREEEEEDPLLSLD